MLKLWIVHISTIYYDRITIIYTLLYIIYNIIRGLITNGAKKNRNNETTV